MSLHGLQSKMSILVLSSGPSGAADDAFEGECLHSSPPVGPVSKVVHSPIRVESKCALRPSFQSPWSCL
eukprot:3949965-Heterocapsa_arctica.AAC.1